MTTRASRGSALSPALTLVGLGLALAAFGAPQAELPPEVLLLARINQKMADNLSRVPNYTCLETIERSQRRSPLQKFDRVDTLRLEVALVNGKEYAPGERFSFPGCRLLLSDKRHICSFDIPGPRASGFWIAIIGLLS